MLMIKVSMTLLIYFTYSISYSQSSLDYHEKVIGQYEKPYQKLDLYSDNTFKNYYNYVSFCGVGNLEYTVIGSYTVNEKENRIKLLPKEYTQFKSFYGINKNIPFDSVTTPSSLKLNLNVIVFGDEIFRLIHKFCESSKKEVDFVHERRK